MTVHFVATNWSQATGRFVGPVALLNHAKELLPELKAIVMFPGEWRGWVDLLEGLGALRPALRWRVPGPALARLWAHHDEREPEGEASSDAAVAAVAALRRWEYANAMWGHAGHATQGLHPLDDPRDGAAAFVENPVAVPWSPRTYDPVMVARRGLDCPHADDHGCVPLFRQWQALLLVELFLSESRPFAGLDRAALERRWPDLASGPAIWRPWSRADGFTKHQATLEALSWHTTYVQHALLLAQGSSLERGLFARAECDPGSRGSKFVIQGPALNALRRAEEQVAREALQRHEVDVETMLGATSWLGDSAIRRRDAGHAKASRAYAELMRQGIELLMNLGLSLDDVKARMRGGSSTIPSFRLSKQPTKFAGL